MEINRILLSSILIFIYFLIILFMVIKRKKLGSQIHYFIIAMLFVFLSESLSLLGTILYGDSFRVNRINVVGVIILFFLSVFVYFYKTLENKRLKTIQLGIIGLDILNIIFSLIFIEDFFIYLPYPTYFVTIFLLLASVALFFFETFNSEKVLNIMDYYPFWIAISLVVLYVGMLPLMIISKNAMELSISRNIFLILLYTVNFTGYTIMLVGIFFSKKTNLNEDNH
ncbi:hypothetical protein [Kaistella haifensis]|nr:hypothetical protein [Kaistella haifensis]